MFRADEGLSLDGKVALVTGGTRGIGRGIAESLAVAGAAVCVVARKEDELAETVTALEALGVKASAFRGSVGSVEVADDAVAHCVAHLGACDILVNNAATNPQFGPLIDAESSAVQKTWQVNIEGPLYLAQAAWRHWMQAHGGVVVNVASIGGIRPTPFIGAYNVSKAALIHLTRQLALEMAPGVRVNAVAPALVKTHFAKALWEPDEERANAMHPLGRMGLPEDVAAAVLFLASEAGSWVTGQVYVLDGGATLT